MVLSALPPPAWLSADAPQSDVVLSSRARYMRNLAGYRFPPKAQHEELMQVMRAALALKGTDRESMGAIKGMTRAERNHLLSSRLISPDFRWQEPSSALLLDRHRAVSVMVNEEDHLRVQCLTAGWSIGAADAMAQAVVDRFGAQLEFAKHPRFGYLSSSPFNAGEGKRLSSMLHLIGLASSSRLQQVLHALNVQGLTARGLFGESSRAVGAFVQVSVSRASRSDFVGALEYLIREERLSRADSATSLAQKAEQAREFVLTARSLSAGEALRVLGWIRWAACTSQSWAPFSPRAVDHLLASSALVSDAPDDEGAAARAKTLRRLLQV